MDRSRKGSATLMSHMGIMGRVGGRGWGSQRDDATKALGAIPSGSRMGLEEQREAATCHGSGAALQVPTLC